MITGLFLSSPSWLQDGGYFVKRCNFFLPDNIFTQLLSSCLDENVYKSVLAEVLPDKGEIKADRELEVQLDCGTLVVSADGVLDLNVNLQRRDTNDEQCLSYWLPVRTCH